MTTFGPGATAQDFAAYFDSIEQDAKHLGEIARDVITPGMSRFVAVIAVRSEARRQGMSPSIDELDALARTVLAI
jgi:hypothetical protein